ncbi:MAG TPA: hypothetical protein VF756_17850 [Thermoanaerobaculia bacterium]
MTGSPRWNRPNVDLQTLSGSSVLYSSLSIFVDRSGVYEITSDQTLFDDPWNGMLFLYAESFDPAKPLENLIAANDDGPGGPATSKVTFPLVAGVIYQVVTTTAQPIDANLNFANRVTGPGAVRTSACFLDEPERRDNGTDMAFLNGRFCVAVTWTDFQGNNGIGRPVGHRSDTSGMFWFFSPDNWELSIKVLDGCSNNSHFWVMISGSTNVGYTVRVRDMLGHSSVGERTYSNPVRRRARTVLDTRAFDGCL